MIADITLFYYVQIMCYYMLHSEIHILFTYFCISYDPMQFGLDHTLTTGVIR